MRIRSTSSRASRSPARSKRRSSIAPRNSSRAPARSSARRSAAGSSTRALTSSSSAGANRTESRGGGGVPHPGRGSENREHPGGPGGAQRGDIVEAGRHGQRARAERATAGDVLRSVAQDDDVRSGKGPAGQQRGALRRQGGEIGAAVRVRSIGPDPGTGKVEARRPEPSVQSSVPSMSNRMSFMTKNRRIDG